MGKQEYYRRLDSTAESPAELFEHFETHSVAGDTHYILADARHGLERGTVIVDEADSVVRGFPSTPRILVLESGIHSVFEDGDRLAIEEKLNGSNIRIVDIDGPVAFTRSGYACPYTTNRVQALLEPVQFFEDHPEKMLCAELIGPETPYTAHDYDDVDSHDFRVFGIRDRQSGDPLPVPQRRELCAEYGFDQPQYFGTYVRANAADEIRDVIAELDASDREGVVIRRQDGKQMIKYTTSAQHQNDLAHAFSLPFEYGREFLFSRLIREAFQAVEFDEGDGGDEGDGNDEGNGGDEGDGKLEQRAHELGESILLPMVESIRDVEAGKILGERHTVRGDDASINALLEHLHNQSIDLEIESDYREGGQRVVEFVKVSESTQDQIQYYLDGGTRDT